MKKFNWILCIVFILFCELIGFVSSKMSGDIKTIYNSLSKPPLAPSSTVFAIVWPILYVLIGIAGYIIYQKVSNKELDNSFLILYYVQLFINFIWPIVFFKYQWMLTSIFLIILLVLLVASLIYRLLNENNQLVAGLLSPYLLWIIFATYLNIGFFLLN